MVARDGMERMSDIGFNYGRLMQRAMRGLMTEVLGEVASRGLPGNHHFYISFDTAHPGVDMPAWLKAEHPEELAIVIQHEFDDLAVLADRFSIRLSFRDRSATLVIPFDAVTTFADPSENFGLRFEPHEPESEDAPEDDPPPPETPAPTDGAAQIVSLDSFRKR
jgi:hypothetical protein